ncbi:helix-turn-helix domain-containing protein [Chengkuizengella sediminis]|uniref:helix-turn-helix domain-containing protein n=1 Tax=Chengkuizengella sediminis TaxID=1885917 RepID=UPI001389F313|nr:helix-turn-helix domain-containing protein [Chengkuizengella sediminis]NDI35718.1 helix-turn-helix transcriptional regulator [Chengkuizengella sediminis]
MKNEYINIGQKIREIRLKMNITQKQMCDGICTQANLSRIENGLCLPSSYIIQQFSERLGIDTSYLLTNNQELQQDYIDEFYTVIRRHLTSRDYESVLTMVQKEEKNPIFSNIKHQQYFLLYKGLCIYYLQKKYNEAVQFIDDALSLRNHNGFYNEDEIEILITKAMILYDHGDPKASISLYKKIITIINEKKELNNKLIYNRVYYNYTRVLVDEKEFREGLKICIRGISFCKRFYSMYYLADLYLNKATIHWNLNEKELCRKSLLRARELSDILDNKLIFDICQQSLSEYFN